jgi:hypothetical protein
MNLHEQGMSREVCINVGLCLQSSSSTTGGLPKSEGKEMNKHNAKICGIEDCQDARGGFSYM